MKKSITLQAAAAAAENHRNKQAKTIANWIEKREQEDKRKLEDGTIILVWRELRPLHRNIQTNRKEEKKEKK